MKNLMEIISPTQQETINNEKLNENDKYDRGMMQEVSDYIVEAQNNVSGNDTKCNERARTSYSFLAGMYSTIIYLQRASESGSGLGHSC